MRARVTVGVALAALGVVPLQSIAPNLGEEPPRQTISATPRVTFAKDIAPILFRHCASCHQPNRAAPFSLLTFDDARQHASDIVEATGERHMPPWLPTPGVAEFVGERRLSDREIALIREWVEQGTREGNRDDLPPVPQSRSGWQLGDPDLVLEMPESYRLPAAETDVYRNFVIPAGIPARRYVRAFELWPDNPRVVHHAVITVDRTRWSRYRDAQDPEPGYDGMLAGQAESPDGHFLAWTPGRTAAPEPDDMAWRLDRGSDLVLQLHMMPSKRPQTVRVRVGLFFTDRAPRRVPLMLRIGPKDIDIPAGRRGYVAEDEYVLPVDVDVLSVYPHAHYLAREMSASARLPDGTPLPLLEIPRWDFHWQDEYRYVRPLSLPRGTTLRMRYEYDNSGDGSRPVPQRVVYGPRSTDEMCDLWLQVVPRTAQDRALLQDELARREAMADIAGFETLLRARPGEATSRTLLGSLYARMGRTADAEREYRQALADAPAEWLTHYNLGAALQARGSVEDADAEYRRAIDLNPQAVEAHHARGLLSYGQRRYQEAMDLFHQALLIWPDYADAHNSLGSALAKAVDAGAAIEEYRRALAIQPDHVPALNNLGILLASRGEVDEAIRLLTHAVDVAPTSAESRKNLAAALALQAEKRR